VNLNISTDRLVLLILVILPLLFMPFTILLDGWKSKGIYDFLYFIFSLILLFFFILNDGRMYFRRVKVLWFLAVIYLIWFLVKLILIKYIIMADYFYWVPYLREFKPFLYFFFVSLVISRWGFPTLDVFIKSGFIFSTFVLFSFVFGSVLLGGGRPEVIDEANYDNLIVLIGYLATVSKFGLKLDLRFLLFLSATLVSQSKTGVVCFLLITFIFSIKELSLKTILQLGFGLLVVVIVLLGRLSNVQEFHDVDRFRMWLSYFDLLKDSSVSQLLFGYMPGVPLRYFDPYIGWFIQFQSEERLNILGLHAFSYHGMWLRVLCTWGLLPLIVIITFMLAQFRVSNAHKAIFSVIIVQGLGMGVFYLSTVSVPILLFIAALNNYYSKENNGVNK
jgi:hypothetical protein